ncbi:Zn-dependent protease [Bacillus mesophilus]|uniref:Site-2 protease family protein n=1 Tax=Bacillus mesophilus TaxID=1808955 RepID=A0A6M0QB36_9BACI|nr:site-2 protease family protein [Bacillus mesophilus]MBM7662414.1 Zn-dependent protease [Bacillus mesophilus]NEY72959.1 site-2 protease family protein [Bacillus mesophilus]
MELLPFQSLDLQTIIFFIITLLIAFTLHEFAHAYVAFKFGDPTAQKQGRLTLSPLKHLDPIGTIALFILGFGWAKPVPVNRFFFKNPRLAGVLVSIAGPLSNLILAFLALLIWFGLIKLGIYGTFSADTEQLVYEFFNVFISINIALFIFNLLPFPPLDGYRILEDLAPNNIRARLTQYEQYGIIIFLILVITPLDQYTISPIFNTVIPFVFDTLSLFVLTLLNMNG